MRFAKTWLVVVFCLLVPVTVFAAPQEIHRWDFDTEKNDWRAGAQCRLRLGDGNLVIQSTGRDPQMVAKVEAPAGWKKLSVRARARGKLRGQVFWTTTEQEGTSEEASARFDWTAKQNAFETFSVYFNPAAPLTSLRFDPLDRKGQVVIDWISLSAEEPRRPEATPAEAIQAPEGFRVERLFSVAPQIEGSWVSLTHDNRGRLITSDQYGRLYRVTTGASEADTVVEPIDIEVGMAQGLLYAFDSLYVMVNGTKADKQGLWRVRDTDGDDKFDTAEHLRHLKGGGEHGPHAVILAPDGKSLYVCAGNHTDPTEFDHTLVPRNWQEDQLLPRMWDAGGHAVGKMAPGGWIAQVSPDGSEWTLVASGFRNEYDIAFNQHGELFSYDADMEWDVGSPWYRPTRVNHVTSGAEFGWRSGTGKWPDWYPDSLGSVVDVGPGSPTGIAFGTGAKFPAKYQHALFIADWSYGIVYAVHMQPDGSSYTGEAERFLSAAPLPVTDLVVNPQDGALYFTIGGRRTQSGLYRVTYAGDAATQTAKLPADGRKLRELRREIESLHHSGAEGAIDVAFRYLDHSDRHIRYAARIALEHQPVDEWQERALSEENPIKLIYALIALCRNGDAELQPRVIGALSKTHGADLSEQQTLDALRVVELAFIRMGEPPEELRTAVARALNGLYPAQSQRLNRELSQLLIYLQDPEAAEKTLDLMASAPSQQEQIQYALWLRALRSGWTPELRRRYFSWFATAAAMRGGNSFTRFLQNIRKEAVETLDDEQREDLAEVLNQSLEPVDPTADLKARPVVRKWTVSELLPAVDQNSGERDFENGRRMFTVTACYKCHRFAGAGGIVGPDLTGAGRRFNNRNLLEAIIEPSKVISDQYQATTFVLESGKAVTGRVANLSGNRIMVIEDMLNPGRMTGVEVDQIEEKLLSETSMMPSGLLDTLTQREALDLIAYLKSGGDPDHPIYRREAGAQE